MWDFLEHALEFSLELLCNGLEWCESWRFFVPVVTAIAIAGAIAASDRPASFKFLSSLAVVLAGLGTGVIWHARSGA